MKKLCVYAILVMGLLGGAVWAQIPVNMQQADSTADGKPYLREHLALPTEIRQMLNENKAKEAVAEYEKFKKTTQADALDMFLLDTEVYGSASFIEPGSNYGKMREEAVRKMLEKYPKNAEALMYTMPEDGNFNKSLDVLNKMIEVDPDYLPAYEYRLDLYNQKMTKEACMDYMKLPESVQKRKYMSVDCKALMEDTENK